MLLGSKCKLIITAISLAIVMSGCDSSKSSQEYITSAQLLIKEGKEAEAIINLKNALKSNNKSAKGRFLLGKAYAQQGNWLAAEKELNRANEYGYNKEDQLLLQAKVFYRLYDSESILEMLEENVELNIETQLGLQTFLAMTYIVEGHPLKGQNILAKIIAKNHISPYTKLSQAWQYGLNKKFELALQTIDSLLDENPTLFEAIEYKAQILFSMGKAKLASDEFQKYVDAHPKAQNSRLMLMLSLSRSNQFVQSEKQADILLRQYPNQALVNQVKAQAKFAKQDFVKAQEYAEKAIRVKGDLSIARVVAGVSAYNLNQLEKAYSHLMVVHESLSFKHPATRLLSVIRLQLGYVDDHISELSTVPLDELDTQILSVSAQELFRVGKLNDAEKMLLRASLLEPDNAKIIYQQGILKLLNGDDSASKFFELALEKNPNLDSAAAMLVMKLIDEDKYLEAIKIAKNAKSLNSQLSHSLLAAIYKKQKNFAKAKSALLSVLAVNKKHIGALFNMGEIAEQEKNIDSALYYYQAAIKVSSKHAPAIMALLRLSKTESNKNNIKMFFEEQVVNTDHNIMASIALADFFVVQQNFPKAIEIISEALDKNKNNIKLLLLKAKVQLDQTEYKISLNSFNEVLKIEANNLLARIGRATIYFRMNDMDNAISEQLKVVELEPLSAQMKIDLAQFYIKNNNTTLAKVILEALNIKNKDNFLVQRLLGKIALVEKNYSKAVKYLSIVYEEQASELVLFELVHALQKSSRHQKAIDLIEILEKKMKQPLPISLKLKQAELYENIDTSQALSIYNDLLQKTDSHYSILNNLAWVYLVIKDDINAMKYGRMAIEKAPESISVKDTYGLILLKLGNKTDALALLEDVYISNKSNDNYVVHYAQALAISNLKSNAAALLKGIKKDNLNEDSLSRLNETKLLLDL